MSLFSFLGFVFVAPLLLLLLRKVTDLGLSRRFGKSERTKLLCFVFGVFGRPRSRGFLTSPQFVLCHALHRVFRPAAARCPPSHVEAGLFAANRAGRKSKAFLAHTRKVKDAVRRGRRSAKTVAIRGDSSCEKSAARGSCSPGENSDEEDEPGALISGRGRVIDRGLDSPQLVSKKHPRLGSLREYKTEDIGRLKDLTADGNKGQPDVRLKAECLRFPTSVTTTVRWSGRGYGRGRRGAG